MDPFPDARWIWCRGAAANAYVLFCRTVALPNAGAPLRVRISASYHYELWVDGAFVARGPVHGDPQWCQVDELEVPCPGDADRWLHVTILVHHSAGTHLHYLLPAPGGLIATFEVGELRFGTDASWACLPLQMWQQDVPARGWALDYCEDYVAALEPPGWQDKVFAPGMTARWARAEIVRDADAIWGGYQARRTPHLQRRFVSPERFRAFCARGAGAEGVGEVSETCDLEPLAPVGGWAPFDVDAVCGRLGEANALTFDLGRERIGFYAFEIDAPAGLVLEISGAELLREGRPWIYRKGTCYSARYRTRAGRQRFTSFSWSGYRYLHLVVRGDAAEVRIHRIGCLERRAPLSYRGAFRTDDEALQRVYDLCRYTIEVGAQEHLIDCPTREQAQYWGDGLWTAESLWTGFGARAYMEWYLDGYLHVPFRDDGQISSTYPGEHISLLDYSLIPLLGQDLYRAHTGAYYRAEETCARALCLKRWYDDHLSEEGLVVFDYEAYAAQGLRNFIDHPGIGWHSFPHPGIDRDGMSCPLNTFYCAFVGTLSEMAAHLGRPEAGSLARQAAGLRDAIRDAFYDGTVFHDARKDGALSAGTSWQANALAVCVGLVEGADATRTMRAMLDGYDTLCRCSPYFFFYLLPALRMAGLEQEARALVVREWGPMLDRDATTTWEGFLGDELDSLCHPWSTAPFLFLLGET
jgi:alpha-L-rhamnosidase